MRVHFSAARRALAAAICALLSVSAWAEYQAVLTKNPAPGMGKSQYDLHFVSLATNEVVNSIDLGANRRTPVAMLNETGDRLWVSNKQPTTKEWELLGFDATSGEEFARLPIGRRPGQPIHQTFWSRETEDGERVVVLGQLKGRWQIDTYRIADGERTSTLPLNKGAIQVGYLTGDRVLAFNPLGRRQVYLIDPIAGKMIWESRLRGDTKRFERSKEGDYLYLIEQEKVGGRAKPAGEMEKRMVEGRDTTIRVLSTVDGKELGAHDVGFDLSAFYHSADNVHAYALSRTSIVTGKSKLWRISGNEVDLVRQHDAPCQPAGVIVDEGEGLATALCEKSVEHGRLAPDAAVSTAKLPAKPEGGFYGPGFESLFLDSSSGSRVAMYQLDPLELMGVRGSGSAGVKFGQALLSVGGIALAATTGYGFLSLPVYSSTAMALSEDERLLHVMNRGTRDVTSFDTTTFKRVALNRVGQLPIGMFRFDNSPYVFGLSINRLIAFEAGKSTPVLDLDGGNFTGLNDDFDRFFYNTDEGAGGLRAEHPEARGADPRPERQLSVDHARAHWHQPLHVALKPGFADRG